MPSIGMYTENSINGYRVNHILHNTESGFSGEPLPISIRPDGTFDETSAAYIAAKAAFDAGNVLTYIGVDGVFYAARSSDYDIAVANSLSWIAQPNADVSAINPFEPPAQDSGGGEQSPVEMVEDYYAAQVHSTAGFKVRRTQRESDGVTVTANAGQTIDGWQTIMMGRPPTAQDTIPQIELTNGMWRINGANGLDAVTTFFAEIFCSAHDHGFQNPSTSPTAGLETGVQTADGSSVGGAVQFAVLRTRDGVEAVVGNIVDADIPAGGGYDDVVSMTIDPLDVADGDTFRLAIRPQPGTNSSADGTGTIYSSFVFVQEVSFAAFFGYNSDTAATIFRALRWKARLTHTIDLPVSDIARIIPLDSPIPLASANEVMIQVRQGSRRNYSNPIPIDGIATLYLPEPFSVDAVGLESTASFPEQNQFSISNIGARASIQRGEDLGTKASTDYVSFGFVFITNADGNVVALWVDDVRIPIVNDLSIVQILTR